MVMLTVVRMVMTVSRRTARSREAARSLIVQPIEDLRQPLSGLQVRENEGQSAAHTPRIPIHYIERRPYIRREIDLIDHEQPAAADSRPAFPGYFISSGDIDHIDGCVD